MAWYGKYEEEDKDGPPKKRPEDDEVRLTARYLNSDNENELIDSSDMKISPKEQEYVDYLFMLFDNNIRWNLKSGKQKTLKEMKQMAKDNGLDIIEWRKINNKKL
jgi:hypothetical protein